MMGKPTLMGGLPFNYSKHKGKIVMCYGVYNLNLIKFSK